MKRKKTKTLYVGRVASNIIEVSRPPAADLNCSWAYAGPLHVPSNLKQ